MFGVLQTLLTPKEVAKILGVSVRTLERWRYEGCGPRFCRVGGGVRYLEEDLLAFVEQGRRKSTSDDGSK